MNGLSAQQIYDLVKDIPVDLGPWLHFNDVNWYSKHNHNYITNPEVEAAFCGFYWKYLVEHTWVVGAEKLWMSHGPDDTRTGGYALHEVGPLGHCEAPSLLAVLCTAMKEALKNRPTAVERSVGESPTDDQIEAILEVSRQQHIEYIRKKNPYKQTPEGIIDEDGRIIEDILGHLNENDDIYRQRLRELDRANLRIKSLEEKLNLSAPSADDCSLGANLLDDIFGAP